MQSAETSWMPANGDLARLRGTYEKLRERLLDMTLRNPMLSYKHRPTSKRQLRIVDEVPEEIFRLLAVDGASLEVVPLSEPDDIPRDEKTDEFVSALTYAKATEAPYLEALQEIDVSGRDHAEAALAEAERALRDRLRVELAMPALEKTKSIDPVQHAQDLGIEPSYDLLAKSTRPVHRDRRIQTLKFPKPLDAILEKLRDDARLAEQETGLSTLFMVFSFLEWAEAEGSTKLFAPLLMLPVRLEAKRSPKGKITYELSATATAAEDNLSLRKRIERDFGILLPEVETDVDATLSVEAHFAKITDSVEHLKGWRVRRQMTLGHLVFGRFAMYADLDPERWSTHPVETNLVGPLIRGTDGSANLETIFGGLPDHRVDDPEVEARAPILIHDADASQHSALVDAMDGQHLVIQGPPGTGKSQTITNLIANALAAGRTVLFLAEKQAALEVVKRRLDVAGLGEFCLELHSDKATPKKLFEHLRERFKVPSSRTAPGLPDTTLTKARRDVSTYVDALHTQAADGATPFGLIWRAIRARSDIGDPLDAFGGIDIPQAQLQRLGEVPEVRDAIRLYAHLAHEFEVAFEPPGSSPWCALQIADHVTPGTARDLVEDLRPFKTKASDAVRIMQSVEDLCIHDVGALRDVVSAASGLPKLEPVPALLEALQRFSGPTVRSYLHDRAREFHLARRSRTNPVPLGLSEALFPIVERLNAAAPDDDRTPRQIIAAATATKDEASRLRQGLASVEHFIRALGFDATFPCEGLNALMLAAISLAQIPQEARSWFAWSPAHDFRAAYDEWKGLVTREAQWRNCFPQAETPWPLADDLRATARLLGRGWLSRVLSFGADRQAIRVTASGLGTNLVLDRAGDLEALATHVEALHAFAVNRAHAQMMGEFWQDLSTPFEAAARGQDLRKTVLDRIRDFPFGREIADVVGCASDANIAMLAPVAAGLRSLRGMAEAVGKLSGPFDQALMELDRRRSLSEHILMADPDRSLSAIDVSLATTFATVEIARERRRLEDRLAGTRVRSELDGIVGTDEDLERAEEASRWIEAVSSYAGHPTIHEALLSPRARTMAERVRTLSVQAAMVFESLERAWSDLQNRYGLDGLDIEQPDELSRRLNDLIGRKDEFAEFVNLRRQRKELAVFGLDAFVERAEMAGIDPRLLPSLFDGLLAKSRAAFLRRSDPVLSQAAGARIQARRDAFVQADRAKIQVDRASVRQALAKSRPLPGSSHGSRKTWTESELLYHEVRKQQRFVPIRDLMHRASASMKLLTPCFMMSPLSLAKFLPRGRVTFDLLVIDEASQMRPEDALGGLLRAKQVVVVGDQKQLPPSNFFNRSGGADGSPVEDEDGSDDIEDESILEACAKTFRSLRMLRWHYRSRCESLIAFSNREFYKNELITFPSARPRSFSVDLVRVEGRYEARRNPFEAKVVAEEAILFMRHHAEELDVTSLGIVTVNSDQRDLIDEEIKRLSAADELVQRFRERTAERGEPFFVKNLENVQGDERDFIFVSMTYGPNVPGGPVAQRFGPIAGKHGHRRLNVLFSRARLRIALFASFGSADVKPSEASAEGVRILKRYFEYAERGGYAEVDANGKADSDFEVEVARRLSDEGFQVDHQVGVSGFRIDLGVRHPDHPERFIAGVECDGAAYHSSKSARDRDRIREDILSVRPGTC